MVIVSGAANDVPAADPRRKLVSGVMRKPLETRRLRALVSKLA